MTPAQLVLVSYGQRFTMWRPRQPITQIGNKGSVGSVGLQAATAPRAPSQGAGNEHQVPGPVPSLRRLRHPPRRPRHPRRLRRILQTLQINVDQLLNLRHHPAELRAHVINLRAFRGIHGCQGTP